MKMNDILNGILTATAGIAIFVKARTFPAIPGQRFGASFFPSVVGGTLVFAGLALAISSVLRKQTKPWLTVLSGMRSARGIVSFALIFASGLFYIFVSQYIGFIVTIFIIMFGLQLWFGGKWRSSLLAALGCSLGFYVVFAVVLRVPLQYTAIERFLF